MLGPISKDAEITEHFLENLIKLFSGDESNSVYELATLIGIPAENLLNESGFKSWYDQWIERYPKMQNGDTFPNDFKSLTETGSLMPWERLILCHSLL